MGIGDGSHFRLMDVSADHVAIPLRYCNVGRSLFEFVDIGNRPLYTFFNPPGEGDFRLAETVEHKIDNAVQHDQQIIPG